MPGKDIIIAEYKYLVIIERSPVPNRKTSRFNVRRRDNECLLGEIKWYSSWRQYCLFPVDDTVWSVGCLTDIQNFIEGLKKERVGGVSG